MLITQLRNATVLAPRGCLPALPKFLPALLYAVIQRIHI